MRAKIETADKSTIFLSAKDGLYNRKTSILNLNNNVIVKSTAGFEMHLDEAVVDTGNGEVVSDKPVDGVHRRSHAQLRPSRSREVGRGRALHRRRGDELEQRRQAAEQPTAAKR